MNYSSFLAILIALGVFVGLTFVGEASGVTASGSATASATPNPLGIVSNIYQYALMIGGLLAFGAVVYGGIKYAVAAGNPGLQSDARDQITQALLGLLLLLGVQIIFTTIGITGFGLPAIATISLPSSTPIVPSTTYCNPPCPPGKVCSNLSGAASCVTPPPLPLSCDPLDPSSCPAGKTCKCDLTPTCSCK